MSDDAFWELVNVGVLVASLAGYAVVLWCNTRANRRQLERLGNAQVAQMRPADTWH